MPNTTIVGVESPARTAGAIRFHSNSRSICIAACTTAGNCVGAQYSSMSRSVNQPILPYTRRWTSSTSSRGTSIVASEPGRFGRNGASSRAGDTWPNPTGPKSASRDTRSRSASSTAMRPPIDCATTAGRAELEDVEQRFERVGERRRACSCPSRAGHRTVRGREDRPRGSRYPAPASAGDVVAPEVGRYRPAVNEQHRRAACAVPTPAPGAARPFGSTTRRDVMSARPAGNH